MITYTWKLTGLKRKDSADLNNIIVQTYWQKIGTDENGNTGIFDGATPFDLSTVDPNNFVKYEDLTEEMILGWIQAEINKNDRYNTHINDQIQKQIDEKAYPAIKVSESEFPWATSDTSSTGTLDTLTEIPYNMEVINQTTE